MENPDTTTLLDAEEWCVQGITTAIWAGPFSEILQVIPQKFHAIAAFLGKISGYLKCFRVIFLKMHFARKKSKAWALRMKIVLI